MKSQRYGLDEITVALRRAINRQASCMCLYVHETVQLKAALKVQFGFSRISLEAWSNITYAYVRKRWHEFGLRGELVVYVGAFGARLKDQPEA